MPAVRPLIDRVCASRELHDYNFVARARPIQNVTERSLACATLSFLSFRIALGTLPNIII